mgnify:CR=1 FL=1
MAVTFKTAGPSTIAREMRGAAIAGRRRAQQKAVDIAKAQGKMAEKGSYGGMLGSLGGALMFANPLLAAIASGVGAGLGKYGMGSKYAAKADVLAKKMERSMAPMAQEERIKGQELYGSKQALKDSALISGLTSAGTTFALRGGGEYLTGGEAADATNPYRWDTGKVDPTTGDAIYETGNVFQRAKQSVANLKGKNPFQTGWGVGKGGIHLGGGTKGGYWKQLAQELKGKGRDIPSLIDYWQGKDISKFTIPALLTAQKKGT